MAENIVAASTLGTFKVGETPLPLSVRFDDSTGTQIDISTGYTATAYWRSRTAAPSAATTLTAAISVAVSALGHAVVTMTPAMASTTGAFFVEVWVGKAANQPALASHTYSYFVEDSITATTPTFPI